MLLSTHAVAGIVVKLRHNCVVNQVFFVLNAFSLGDSYRFDIGSASTTSKHDLRGFEFRQVHITLHFAELLVILKDLHNHGVIAIIN